MSITPAVMTVEEVAEYLSTTPTHIRRLKHDGKIPYIMVGGLMRFPRTDIDAWITSTVVWPLT